MISFVKALIAILERFNLNCSSGIYPLALIELKNILIIVGNNLRKCLRILIIEDQSHRTGFRVSSV